MADMLWCGERRRKKRSDALTDKCEADVLSFWEANSSVSSNTKDLRYRMVKDRGSWIKRPLQFLQTTQTEVFLAFKQKHPEHKIAQRAFELLKPSYVRAVRDIERNVCCCRYHVEMILLKEAVNSMRGVGSSTHPRGACACACTDVCHRSDGAVKCEAATHSCYENLWSMRQEVLCSKGEEEWYNMACLKGECTNCGISKLRICPMEDKNALPAAHVKFCKFVYQARPPNKKGLC